MAKWKRERVEDNHGKPLDLYRLNGYTLCLNLNRGKDAKAGETDKDGNHWWYEVSETVNGHGKERVIGESPTLAGAKRLVK